MSLPHVVVLAAKDPRMRGAPTSVLLWCLETLDRHEWRPVKVLLLSHELRMSKQTAVGALRQLVAIGYLLKGPRPKGEVRQYRLSHPTHQHEQIVRGERVPRDIPLDERA